MTAAQFIAAGLPVACLAILAVAVAVRFQLDRIDKPHDGAWWHTFDRGAHLRREAEAKAKQDPERRA